MRLFFSLADNCKLKLWNVIKSNLMIRKSCSLFHTLIKHFWCFSDTTILLSCIELTFFLTFIMTSQLYINTQCFAINQFHIFGESMSKLRFFGGSWITIIDIYVYLNTIFGIYNKFLFSLEQAMFLYCKTWLVFE